MSLADEMRGISQAQGGGIVEDAYQVALKRIRKAAEEGKQEIVWSPSVSDPKKFGLDYAFSLSDRDKELLKERLERDGFRVVCPHRISAGVIQRTEYIQW